MQTIQILKQISNNYKGRHVKVDHTTDLEQFQAKPKWEAIIVIGDFIKKQAVCK